MTPDPTLTNLTLLTETVDITSSYVANNPVPIADLPKLISSVHMALQGITGAPAAPAAPPVEKASPADIRKSITPDALISFIDGKPYKTLRRHLTASGLTPESYRAKHGLPGDYPMVAASYAAQRSALAKSIGLGQRRASA